MIIERKILYSFQLFQFTGPVIEFHDNLFCYRRNCYRRNKFNKFDLNSQTSNQRKVVADHYTSVSGTAVDILKNIPSIDVDIEDNVSIRGNSNFTVLIDGRPSVLKGSEALQQFPAGMIKDIEIITNPSAKFDPEGTGGIINIITTKRTLTGLKSKRFLLLPPLQTPGSHFYAESYSPD